MTADYRPERLSTIETRTSGNESWLQTQRAFVADARAEGQRLTLTMACGCPENFDAGMSPERLRALTSELCTCCVLLVAREMEA